MFDEKKARRVIRFIECLKHTKGEFHGKPFKLLPWQETVTDVARLAPLVRRADAVAAVLPPELLEKLLALAQGKPVLCAVNQRRATGRFRILPDGRREQEFAYVHGGWEQLLRLDIQMRRL